MQSQNTKLTWSEIEKRYDQEWVQLVNYDWPEGEPYPSSGVVQFHSPKRKEFDALSRENPVEDAACVFVGEVHVPENTIWSRVLYHHG